MYSKKYFCNFEKTFRNLRGFFSSLKENFYEQAVWKTGLQLSLIYLYRVYVYFKKKLSVVGGITLNLLQSWLLSFRCVIPPFSNLYPNCAK